MLWQRCFLQDGWVQQQDAACSTKHHVQRTTCHSAWLADAAVAPGAGGPLAGTSLPGRACGLSWSSSGSWSCCGSQTPVNRSATRSFGLSGDACAWVPMSRIPAILVRHCSASVPTWCRPEQAHLHVAVGASIGASRVIVRIGPGCVIERLALPCMPSCVTAVRLQALGC